ncbi:Retrovirus-related Pol polyprotein from transposon RE1 [Vitis vinifera]|uniref:Retrovirus-related Pol polyprotein from transposon RE1 n=1 Tax=Vitis vinifera TaxID=29760 RepID=A0A438J1B6_VITVI|nr:Retrovirus-related Pol polyprotein from transposon RE1 [Vitis vinifera]
MNLDNLKLVNQEASELDTSGQQFGSEDVFIEIPNQLSSVEAIPNSVQEALADPRWKAVMNEEMKSLQKNERWELVECPPGKKPVGVVGSILMHGVRKAMSEGVQIEEVIVWAEAIPRAWFGRFTKSMRAFGYRQSNSDHTLFLKKQHEEFEMKDLGHLKYFLGIEVSRSSEGIFLSQRNYALDLLQKTGMSGCQPVNTPIKEGLKLCVEPNQVSTDKEKYHKLVGRLMYLAHTRPDLAYALSVVSQYMHNPGEQHMNAVMRILRYLKNAPGKRILFAKNVNHQSIEVYTNADWAGAVDDRRSTSGYFTFVGGNLVTWKVRSRMSSLVQVQKQNLEHVEVDRFFIKEKLDDKIVELPKIQSEDQLADILTKVVSSQVFSKFLDKLGMCDIFAPT